jgi:hypothetical protein
VRLFFTGFDPRSRVVLTSVGVGNYDGDNFRTSGSGQAWLMWEGPINRPLWLLAGVGINNVNGAENYREVGLVYEAATTSASNELNGTYCVFGTTPTSEYLQIFDRNRPMGDEVVTQDLSPGLVQVNFDGMVRGVWNRSAIPAAGGSFLMGNTESGISATPNPLPPASGNLALFGSHLDASFRFLFVVTRP